MVVLENNIVKYQADGEKVIAYLTAGPVDGPLLVFIHGWPAIGKTWKAQLEAFALLGFRVAAPDMPGYGGSTVNKKTSDYSLEMINTGMLALLQHLGRDQAVWIGHDWGAPAVWSFASHYPEKTTAVAGIAVPYGVIEKGGLKEEVRLVNRDIYPEDQYPYGQWDYQRFYETDFEKATAWFDADVPAFIRAAYSKGHPESMGKPAMTSTVCKDGGWMGGGQGPNPEFRHIPAEYMCIDEEMYAELVQAMQKTGFWGADAWYSNHERNTTYFDEKVKNSGYLEMPVLFIQALYDGICDTVHSPLAEPQRKLCKNLTEVSVASGHWAPQEKPAEVSAAIARWLVESVKDLWPVTWTRSPA